MQAREREPDAPVSASAASSPSPAAGTAASGAGTEGNGEPERGRTRARGDSRGTRGAQAGGNGRDKRPPAGYHAFAALGRIFNVEQRWTLGRELGQGAYGVVVAAEDKICGETVAIKLVTRVFEKVQLAKRVLREITLLRFLAGHDNITGLIDLDAPGNVHDYNEIYLFMEPMEADLHMIIRSGQQLTNEHCSYFVYQILRGMKYLHSGNIIHRDLKPGNLLVNSDCELKIADFGLARSFATECEGETVTHMTEYVATRWYRAPEIMLSFKSYTTAIDVWSIGCILAELLMGKPIFKGKDYVDQVNKILEILGTPSEKVLQAISSERAQAYVRSLPIKKPVHLATLMGRADFDALDLLRKMLSLDPNDRPTVMQALEHRWLGTYHDVADEPEAPKSFQKWHDIEKLETLDQYRQAIWDEVQDYRREVRSAAAAAKRKRELAAAAPAAEPHEEPVPEPPATSPPPQYEEPESIAPTTEPEFAPALSSTDSVVDPIAMYAGVRRSSQLAVQQYEFPTTGAEPEHFIKPSRSRAGSGSAPEPMLRTLSTVSVRERGAAAALANMGFGLTQDQTADAPPSEIPLEFRTKADREREAKEKAAAAAELQNGEHHENGAAPDEPKVNGKTETKSGLAGLKDAPQLLADFEKAPPGCEVA
ncbi:kinase-like protein [Auricularia subglabra TFB-10046 SS5]|nr:kinase-like protein [Auricularia subglabra TFB-10046 SS5]